MRIKRPGSPKAPDLEITVVPSQRPPRIAERGTHADLLGQNGRYAALWRRQEEEEQTPEGPGTGAALEASTPPTHRP